MTIHHLATYVNKSTIALTTERFGLPVATVVQTESDSWSVLLAHRFGFLGEKRPDERTYLSADAACADVVGWSNDCYRLSS